MRWLTLILLCTILVGCKPPRANDAPVITVDTLVVRDTVAPSAWGKMQLGKVVPDLNDSTLLKLIYGGYNLKDGWYYFNCGSFLQQPPDYFDSIRIGIISRFGDDSTQMIFMRGFSQQFSEDYANIAGLLLNKTASGWQLTDCRIDSNTFMDIGNRQLMGIYAGNYFLIKNTQLDETRWDDDQHVEIYLASRKSLLGPGNTFLISSSNTNNRHKRCDSSEFIIPTQDNEPDTPLHYGECDCFKGKGKLKCDYDRNLGCIIIQYTYLHTLYDYGFKNPQTDTIYQTWYLNEDIALLAHGQVLDFDNSATGQEINLSPEQISHIMKKEGRSFVWTKKQEAVMPVPKEWR